MNINNSNLPISKFIKADFLKETKNLANGILFILKSIKISKTKKFLSINYLRLIRYTSDLFFEYCRLN